MPLRSGKSHRSHSTRALQKRLWSWIEGNYDDVWEAALKVEMQRNCKVRRKKNANPKSPKEIEPWSERDMDSRYRRAKSLANDGEYSKAFSAIVDRGKAPLSHKVLEDLRSMNPSRINQVK